MLDSNLNFPYPLLRNERVDFGDTVFKSELNVEIEEEGYKVTVSCDVNNKYFGDLLVQGKIAYAVQIQCVSTWFRRLEILNSTKMEFFISSKDVHEKVEMCPCIIALEDIGEYSCDDFSEEFIGMKYSIRKNEVIGIGERKKFDAIYEKDIIKKAASIVSICEDRTCSTIECEMHFETINIKLPKKQYDLYNQCGLEKQKYSIINSIIVVPVIVQAISYIYEDEKCGSNSGYENYAWYKTIKYKLKKICGNNNSKYMQLLETPVKSAQIIIDNISENALEILTKLENRQ